jgi:hypothetical protein
MADTKATMGSAWALVSPKGKVKINSICARKTDVFLSIYDEDRGYKVRKVLINAVPLVTRRVTR